MLEDNERILVEGLFRASVEAGKAAPLPGAGCARLAGDVGERKYYRIGDEGQGHVVCLDEGGGAAFVEARALLARHGVRVPAVLDHDPGKGYVLQEDLGGRTLLAEAGACGGPGGERALYESAVAQLARIQAAGAGGDPGAPSPPFDTAFLMGEVGQSVEHFVGGFLGRPLDAGEEKTLNGQFLSVCQTLSRQRTLLGHRDYHSRNIMIKDGEQVVIDFQDCRMAVPQYDLASLLEDCYRSVDPSLKEGLKALHRDLLREEGYAVSEEEYGRIYDLAAVQRIFKALGTFARVERARGDRRHIRHVGAAFENLRRILLPHRELRGSREILCRAYYES